MSIDSGFIVFNRRNYPMFSEWLDQLRVASRSTDMSFSVTHRGSGLEYGTDRVGALLAQPVNALRPRFVRMLADIRRFYRDARALDSADADLTVAQFVDRKGYGARLSRGSSAAHLRRVVVTARRPGRVWLRSVTSSRS